MDLTLFKFTIIIMSKAKIMCDGKAATVPRKGTIILGEKLEAAEYYK